MSKHNQKNFIKKTDLRKVKYNGTNKDRQDKLFPSDEGITEEELAGGVVVDVKKLENGDFNFYVVKTFSSSYQCSVCKNVVIPANVINTIGICCWGKNSFKVFNPQLEDTFNIIGESVKYIGDGSITLNSNSLANRVVLLCQTASYICEEENKEKITNNIKNMITKYVFKVIESKNLSKRDKEFLLNKVEELFNCELQYVAQNFKDLKRIMQQKCNEHAKNNRVYTQKTSYVNVYE